MNQLKNDNDSLVGIAYEQNYFDSSHFIKDLQNISGLSSREIKEILSKFQHFNPSK